MIDSGIAEGVSIRKTNIKFDPGNIQYHSLPSPLFYNEKFTIEYIIGIPVTDFLDKFDKLIVLDTDSDEKRKEAEEKEKILKLSIDTGLVYLSNLKKVKSGTGVGDYVNLQKYKGQAEIPAELYDIIDRLFLHKQSPQESD